LTTLPFTKLDFISAFSGETSAGKTTLLNLLLGEELLPCDWGSTTSIVTRLSYGATRRATVNYRNGTKYEINIETQEEKDKLWKLIAEQDLAKRLQPSDVSEVCIYLPSSVLKVNIY
jgi:hypothetical protein